MFMKIQKLNPFAQRFAKKALFVYNVDFSMIVAYLYTYYVF